MDWVTIVEFLAATVVGVASGYLPARLTHKKKLHEHGKTEVRSYVTALNSKYKTVERTLGTCTCGSGVSVIDIIPESLSLSTSFTRKTILDPATGKPASHFRAITEPGRAS